MRKLFSARKLGLSIAGFLMTFGIVTNRTQPVLSNEMEPTPVAAAQVDNTTDESQIAVANIFNLEPQSTEKGEDTLTALVVSPQAGITQQSFPTKNGVYLYGQAKQANQIGKGYVVVEVKEGQANGALYMPSSEYSCFNGQLKKSGELAMTVKSSPGEAAPPEVAANGAVDISNNIDEPVTYAYSLGLQSYHRLDEVSGLDRQILQQCRTLQQ
jgi:hypothetical protein